MFWGSSRSNVHLQYSQYSEKSPSWCFQKCEGAFSKYCVYLYIDRYIDKDQNWLTLWTEDGEEQRVAAEQAAAPSPPPPSPPPSPSPDRRKSFSMSRSSTVETAETILRWPDALLNIYSDGFWYYCTVMVTVSLPPFFIYFPFSALSPRIQCPGHSSRCLDQQERQTRSPGSRCPTSSPCGACRAAPSTPS